MHGLQSAISDFLVFFEQNHARPNQIVAQDSRASYVAGCDTESVCLVYNATMDDLSFLLEIIEIESFASKAVSNTSFDKQDLPALTKVKKFKDGKNFHIFEIWPRK